jgi:hypothetical protein
MPWYWTDDLARVLLETGRIDAGTAAALVAAPIGVRRQDLIVEEPTADPSDDEEIPHAA